MGDNVVIFATIMKVFATVIIYRLYMANFAISIGVLSFQCTHPWVFFAIIYECFMI